MLDFDLDWLDGIDIFGIGSYDFSRGQGYLGEPSNPDVARATRKLTDGIHGVGRKMVADVP